MKAPYYDEDGDFIEHEDYFEGSGCASIALIIVLIVVSLAVAGGIICLFT